MKHKNMKQYEEKNAPKLNHDITLEEIEAACRGVPRYCKRTKRKNAGTVYKRKG